jgi:hypothetical protein
MLMNRVAAWGHEVQLNPGADKYQKWVYTSTPSEKKIELGGYYLRSCIVDVSDSSFALETRVAKIFV